MDDVARKERLAFAIRAAMAAAGETNDTLAAKLGKSVTTVGRWARGDTAPNVLELSPLADALGVLPLLFVEPPPVPQYPLEEYLVRRATEAGVDEGLRRAQDRRRKHGGA